MTLIQRALVVGLCCAGLGMVAVTAQEEAMGPPIEMSLVDAIQMSLQNNLDIKVASYDPLQRQQDVVFQQAVFDPNLTGLAQKSDNKQPSLNVFDVGAAGTIASIESTTNFFQTTFTDPLSYGASYLVDLQMTRQTSNSANAVFPTTYFSQLRFQYDQSLLRDFGTKNNKTQIVIAQNNEKISQSQFRDQVLTTLKATEDAFWELVFARDDLEVKTESLRLAEELLKLNRIKVDVGTLPPIEITQAEAEVANREQGVIVAENAVRNAEDNLRGVVNMPHESMNWSRPIVPTDEPSFVELEVDLFKAFEVGLANRPDLEQARLNINTAETQMALDRNQLKWDLNFRGSFTLQGLAGDIEQQSGDAFIQTACDDSGADGIPGTADPGEGDGICNPTERPGVITFNDVPQFAEGDLQNQDFGDSLEFIRDGDFKSWSATLFLGIPIGNNSRDATYVSSRLAKEQNDIRYQQAKLAAEVEIRTAARSILTDRKRIEAAEKNVELQRKKVEAEQKKFENGMSTSFQVLEFQEDLTTALGEKNRALVDYRKSITSLERAKGTLNEYLGVTMGY